MLLDQVMKLLEACLVEKTDALHNSPFYSLFAAVLHDHDARADTDVTYAQTPLASSLRSRMETLLIEKVTQSDGDQESPVLMRVKDFVDCYIRGGRETLTGDTSVEAKVRVHTSRSRISSTNF